MSSEVVLSLTEVRTELGSSALEQHIANALALPRSRVTVLIDEGRAATLVAYFPEDDDNDCVGDDVSSDNADAYAIAAKLNGAIRRGEAETWAIGRDATTCMVAADEETASIDEEEALAMWREMSMEDRTGHLDEVPSPDGTMVRPSHDNVAHRAADDTIVASPTESQLRRDPTLLEQDNVRRVDASRIGDLSSWDEPVVITNAISDDAFANYGGALDCRRLASVHGEIEVRTGNRETLVDNGITNSRPMSLSEAVSLSATSPAAVASGRIVFSPVRELPDALLDELTPFFDCFPQRVDRGFPYSMEKFTLTIAHEGFGIGMHKHKAAMFMLLAGRKKWYMASSESLDGDGARTHPGFYRGKSSHKCIQKEGEILFVPNDWYHEIFNLEYTAGIQAI